MGQIDVQASGAAAAAEGRATPGTLTIGELATCTGVTPETIRYYEREGVIPRAERHGAGQYRRYGARDAARLRFVRRTRDLGFSLAEVRELLDLANGEGAGPCVEVNRIARSHLAQVDAKLAQLAALRAELGHLVRVCERGDTVVGCGLLNALSGTADVS